MSLLLNKTETDHHGSQLVTTTLEIIKENIPTLSNERLVKCYPKVYLPFNDCSVDFVERVQPLVNAFNEDHCYFKKMEEPEPDLRITGINMPERENAWQKGSKRIVLKQCIEHPFMLEQKDDESVKPGDTFDTMEDFVNYVNLHGKQWLYYYTCNSSRPKQYVYEYGCKFKNIVRPCEYSKSKGIRIRVPKTPSKCPCRIILNRIGDDAHFTAVYVCNHHDHELSVEKFNKQPHLKRLPIEIKEEIIDLASFDLDLVVLRKHISSISGFNLKASHVRRYITKIKKHNVDRQYSAEQIKMLSKKMKELTEMYGKTPKKSSENNPLDTQKSVKKSQPKGDTAFEALKVMAELSRNKKKTTANEGDTAGKNNRICKTKKKASKTRSKAAPNEVSGNVLGSKATTNEVSSNVLRSKSTPNEVSGKSRLETCLETLSYNKEVLESVEKLQQSVRCETQVNPWFTDFCNPNWSLMPVHSGEIGKDNTAHAFLTQGINCQKSDNFTNNYYDYSYNNIVTLPELSEGNHSIDVPDNNSYIENDLIEYDAIQENVTMESNDSEIQMLPEHTNYISIDKHSVDVPDNNIVNDSDPNGCYSNSELIEYDVTQDNVIIENVNETYMFPELSKGNYAVDVSDNICVPNNVPDESHNKNDLIEYDNIQENDAMETDEIQTLPEQPNDLSEGNYSIDVSDHNSVYKNVPSDNYKNNKLIESDIIPENVTMENSIECNDVQYHDSNYCAHQDQVSVYHQNENNTITSEDNHINAMNNLNVDGSVEYKKRTEHENEESVRNENKVCGKSLRVFTLQPSIANCGVLLSNTSTKKIAAAVKKKIIYVEKGVQVDYDSFTTESYVDQSEGMTGHVYIHKYNLDHYMTCKNMSNYIGKMATTIDINVFDVLKNIYTGKAMLKMTTVKKHKLNYVNLSYITKNMPYAYHDYQNFSINSLEHYKKDASKYFNDILQSKEEKSTIIAELNGLKVNMKSLEYDNRDLRRKNQSLAELNSKYNIDELIMENNKDKVKALECDNTDLKIKNQSLEELNLKYKTYIKELIANANIDKLQALECENKDLKFKNQSLEELNLKHKTNIEELITKVNKDNSKALECENKELKIRNQCLAEWNSKYKTKIINFKTKFKKDKFKALGCENKDLKLKNRSLEELNLKHKTNIKKLITKVNRDNSKVLECTNKELKIRNQCLEELNSKYKKNIKILKTELKKDKLKAIECENKDLKLKNQSLEELNLKHKTNIKELLTMVNKDNSMALECENKGLKIRNLCLEKLNSKYKTSIKNLKTEMECDNKDLKIKIQSLDEVNRSYKTNIEELITEINNERQLWKEIIHDLGKRCNDCDQTNLSSDNTPKQINKHQILPNHDRSNSDSIPNKDTEIVSNKNKNQAFQTEDIQHFNIKPKHLPNVSFHIENKISKANDATMLQKMRVLNNNDKEIVKELVDTNVSIKNKRESICISKKGELNSTNSFITITKNVINIKPVKKFINVQDEVKQLHNYCKETKFRKPKRIVMMSRKGNSLQHIKGRNNAITIPALSETVDNAQIKNLDEKLEETEHE